jgi:PAS domain S-box-containing protein
MTPQPQTGSPPADEATLQPLIEQLERVYRHVAISSPDGRIQWASAPWMALCGREVDCAGHDLREAISKLPKPEQSVFMLAELRERGFLLGSPLEIADRESRPVAFEVSVLPLLTAAGQEAFNLLIARPTPERVRQPERHSILESGANAVVAVDRDGFITYANPAFERLSGIGLADIEGSPLAALSNTAEDAAALLAALGSDAALEVELKLRQMKEEGVPVVAAVAPHRRADGTLEGAVVSLSDVSARRRVESELARRNDELEHCVNTLAHDLRSPLVALLGFSRLLRQDYGSRLDDTGAHFVDRIEQAGRTMEGLIHDLLELSRIGRHGERPAMVDPRTVLAQLAAEFKPRLDAEGIRLALPNDPPLVYCDRTRLYQVLANLIGNAINHMGECEARGISVDVVEEEDVDHITVRDFGRGIAPEHHEKIFEVFQTLGPRRDDARGTGTGTGMGLAIVRKIAETHGGGAWVESRPNRGATFHVTFPRR